MKKKICMILLSMCVATSFVACAGETKKNEDTKEETTATTEEEDAQKEDSAGGEESPELTADTRIVSVVKDEMDKYVTLGKYKGLTVSKEVSEVTDADIDTQISSNLSESMEAVEDENATVEMGDTVNIDYEGKKDGVAFDGGTAQGYDLTIGSGTFIDGFEDGLIGAKKGETLDLDVTFPETYDNNPDLAGQPVVFTVTVNEIKRAPELTEEWVTGNTDFDSLDAYKENVRTQLEETNASSADNTAMNDAWSQVLEASEVTEFPQDDIDTSVKEYQASLTSYAQQSDMEEEEFLESQGMTQEEFDEQSQQYAEYIVKQKLVAQAIMDAEGFTLVDDKSKEIQDELVAQYGVESLDALIEQYGADSVYQVIATTRVNQFVMENADVTETIATEDGKDGYDGNEEEVDGSESTDEQEDASQETE